MNEQTDECEHVVHTWLVTSPYIDVAT